MAYPPILKKIRKTGGKIKSVLFDRWPYARVAARVPQMRADLHPLIDSLPAVVSRAPAVFEVHMLCGDRDIDMGILASWSLFRFLDGKGKLIVHSDGSLGEEHENRWRRIIDRIEFVSRSESDRAAFDSISHTKELHPWRVSNWASAQLVDAHLFGSAPSILVMDSDVLVFKKPTAVLEALLADQPRFGWCADLRNAYPAEIDTVEQITGVRMVPRLCAGFLVAPRLTQEDFVKLDKYMCSLRNDGRVDLDHFWSCQCYYALLAAAHANSGIFSPEYRNTMGATDPKQILRHYVGIPSVRFRYFTEGCPMILADLGGVK